MFWIKVFLLFSVHVVRVNERSTMTVIRRHKTDILLSSFWQSISAVWSWYQQLVSDLCNVDFIMFLSYDVASESVIMSCIKNDNPLVD